MADIVATLRLTGPPGTDPVDYGRIVADFQRLVEVMNRRYVRAGSGMAIDWHLEIPQMATITVAFEITVSANEIIQVLFDGGNGPIVKTLSDTNAGATVTTITATNLTTGSPYLTPITFAGDEDTLFELTNGGVCPCDLVVGATDLPEGSHIGIWTITAPVP